MRKELHEFVVVFVYHPYSVEEIMMDRATCRQGRLRGRGSALLFLVGGCLVGNQSFTQKVVINDRFDMLALSAHD